MAANAEGAGAPMTDPLVTLLDQYPPQHKAECHIATDENGEYVNCYRPLGGCDCGLDQLLAALRQRDQRVQDVIAWLDSPEREKFRGWHNDDGTAYTPFLVAAAKVRAALLSAPVGEK